MKVGDLVKAPHLMDHDGSVGVVVSIEMLTAAVWFPSGSRCVFPFLLEVVNASR
jgi:hypothetical protein